MTELPTPASGSAGDGGSRNPKGARALTPELDPHRWEALVAHIVAEARPLLEARRRQHMDLARMRVTDRMARALQLTDEQREAIEEAMERSRFAAQEAMEEVLPRLQSRLDSLHTEIDGILDEEQREAFRKFRSQDRNRFRREGSRWFRGPGRGGSR